MRQNKMNKLDLTHIQDWARTQRQIVQTVERQKMPSKRGLQSAEGQARMLHNLANVELQAVELGVRTFSEFPEAPPDFRAELFALVHEERGHFELCGAGIERLGFRWGQWPVHAMLNAAVTSEDTLLERIFIVHCYLEGSGLDSGDVLLRRFSGVKSDDARQIIEKIVRDEVKHVGFGVRWFRDVAKQDGLDPCREMVRMIDSLFHRDRLPSRGAEIAVHLRREAGFSDEEIHKISFVQQQYKVGATLQSSISF